jgi:hypothetical protein
MHSQGEPDGSVTNDPTLYLRPTTISRTVGFLELFAFFQPTQPTIQPSPQYPPSCKPSHVEDARDIAQVALPNLMRTGPRSPIWLSAEGYRTELPSATTVCSTSAIPFNPNSRPLFTPRLHLNTDWNPTVQARSLNAASNSSSNNWYKEIPSRLHRRLLR